MTTQTEENHAISNAKAWFNEIKLWAALYDDDETHDDAAENVPQPLSVEVRSPWYSPGSEPEHPAEYMILLSTGGPALRIIGELDGYGQPDDARLEWQDWGTPWIEHRCEDPNDALLTYARSFYFSD